MLFKFIVEFLQICFCIYAHALRCKSMYIYIIYKNTNILFIVQKIKKTF